MLSIGEFSRVTQLTVKALRLYHEKGILIPDKIDYDSKYRYYRSSAVEKARVIKRLKDMGFSLTEIKEIVLECRDDRQMVALVEEKLKTVEETIRRYRDIEQELSMFLQSTEEVKESHPADIREEIIPGIWICGIRFKGRYHEVGARLVTLFKKCGRYSKGKPFTLYYDGEYKEEGADIEACVEVKKKVDIEGINCRELRGGNALTLFHRGPFEELGRSYQKLYEYCRERHLKMILPIREQYVKGPGFIFRGNPRKYITKIMIFYENHEQK
jgi:DNA-binding transcriptional MerR regulator